jgi:hypothetical protein
MLVVREEIALTHYQHLEREYQDAETVYVEQCIGVTYLHQIGYLKNLEKIYESHRALGRKKLMELLPIGFWPIKPL